MLLPVTTLRSPLARAMPMPDSGMSPSSPSGGQNALLSWTSLPVMAKSPEALPITMTTDAVPARLVARPRCPSWRRAGRCRRAGCRWHGCRRSSTLAFGESPT